MNKIAIAEWDELEDRAPAYALVADVDLVIVRYDDSVSVLYGRCAHRGALMSDGYIDGDNLICGLHGWDYRVDTGVSEYNNSETLQRFNAWVEDGDVFVDEDEIGEWAKAHPQPFQRDAYQGAYQDPHGTPAEPHVALIRRLVDHCDEILVAEDGYPFIERRLNGVLGVPGKAIKGKLTGDLPPTGELSPDLLATALGRPAIGAIRPVDDLAGRPGFGRRGGGVMSAPRGALPMAAPAKRAPRALDDLLRRGLSQGVQRRLAGAVVHRAPLRRRRRPAGRKC